MKRSAFLLLAIISASSCAYKSDDDVAKEEYSSVVNCIIGKKKDELIGLFAKNIHSKIKDFEVQVNGLMDYVNGTLVSSTYTGTGAEYTTDAFRQIRFLPMAACELYTTDSKYFLSVLYCSIDDYDAGNVGIWNLMVQRCSSEEDKFVAYSSYDEWKNGDKYRGITLV